MFKHKYQVLNFNTKKIRYYICQSVVHAMRKKIHEFTQYFSSYERKHMPPFVVLKHIKLSNLITHKATYNEQLFKSRMSDHH